MSTNKSPTDEQPKDAESEALAQAKAESEAGPDDLSGVEAAEIDAAPEPDLSLDKLQARARKFEPAEVARVLESLLFVAGFPLTAEAVEKATGIAQDVASKAFAELATRYATDAGGVVLHEVAGGWQLRSAASSAEFVRRLLQLKPQRLTRAALETLAIVGYRQPITRPEVEDIRAVDSGAIIKALLERKLIKILGKKEEPGHPLLYGTTREFLEFFNLKNLASLPTLREFQELTEESREIVEKEVGPAAISGTVAQLSDPDFQARQKKSAEASEAALVELEVAMHAAEAKAKETHEILNPPPPAAPAGAEPVAVKEHDTQPDVTAAPAELVPESVAPKKRKPKAAPEAKE